MSSPGQAPFLRIPFTVFDVTWEVVEVEEEQEVEVGLASSSTAVLFPLIPTPLVPILDFLCFPSSPSPSSSSSSSPSPSTSSPLSSSSPSSNITEEPATVTTRLPCDSSSIRLLLLLLLLPPMMMLLLTPLFMLDWRLFVPS